MSRFACVLMLLLPIGCGGNDATTIGTAPPANPSTNADEPGNPPQTVEVEVRRTFGSVAEAIETLSAATQEKQNPQIRAASDWLAGRGAEAVEPLAALAGDSVEDPAVRAAACRVLGQIGAPAVPRLLAALNSDLTVVRHKAIEGLGGVRPTSPGIVAALIALLDDNDPMIRRSAVRALAQIGEPAKAAEARLLAILNSMDENETIRAEAQRALRSVAPRRQVTFD